jgi:hypothetical protein
MVYWSFFCSRERKKRRRRRSVVVDAVVLGGIVEWSSRIAEGRGRILCRCYD